MTEKKGYCFKSDMPKKKDLTVTGGREQHHCICRELCLHLIGLPESASFRFVYTPGNPLC